MPRDDAGLLVVSGGVSGELKDFGGEVLDDGGQVDGGSGSDAFGVVALPEERKQVKIRPYPRSSRPLSRGSN